MKALKVALILFGIYFILLPVRDIVNEDIRPYRSDVLERHLRSVSGTSPEAEYAKEWIRNGFIAFTKRKEATLNGHFVSAGLGLCILCAGLYLIRWNPSQNRNEN